MRRCGAIFIEGIDMNAKAIACIAGGFVAGSAHAGVTATITAASDYDLRGFSQTSKDPALQAGLDYVDDSGWYVSGWASNLDFGAPKPHLEADVFGGFAKTLDNQFGYDVGAIVYTYHSNPNPGLDFFEVYAGVSYDWLKTKLSYSPKFGGDAAKAVNPNVSAFYFSADATAPLPAKFSALGHVGYAWGDYWNNVYGDDVTDYSIGVGYAVGKFNLALKYVNTSTSVKITGDAFNNESRVIFSIATTLPW